MTQSNAFWHIVPGPSVRDATFLEHRERCVQSQHSGRQRRDSVAQSVRQLILMETRIYHPFEG